jgi:hypothetical protein
MQKLLELASSKTAIFVYIAIVAVIVILIIMMTMKNEDKAPRIISTGVSQPTVAYPIVVGKTKEKDDEEEGRSRFCMLCTLDTNRARFQRTTYDESITLKRFCEEFRNFACSKLKLYYSIDDIRRFIAGLTVTKIIILQGMSGSPILQDGKLVGAITHVFLNDSTRGYAISIQNMLIA